MGPRLNPSPQCTNLLARSLFIHDMETKRVSMRWGLSRIGSKWRLVYKFKQVSKHLNVTKYVWITQPCQHWLLLRRIPQAPIREYKNKVSICGRSENGVTWFLRGVSENLSDFKWYCGPDYMSRIGLVLPGFDEISSLLFNVTKINFVITWNYDDDYRKKMNRQP